MHLLQWLLPSPATVPQPPLDFAAASLTSSDDFVTEFAMLLPIDFAGFEGSPVFHPIVVFLYDIAPFGFGSSSRISEEYQSLIPLLDAFASFGLDEAGSTIEFAVGFMHLLLESFERFGLVLRFMESRLKIIESHFAVFFSSVFALILVFTVKS